MGAAAVPEAPLAVFSDCHARTLKQCAALQRLVLYLGECGCDAHARRFAQQIVRYFDMLTPQNHAEEETWLFPAILESMAGSDAVCLREVSCGLTWQHRSLETLWDELRDEVCAVASGRSAVLDAGDVEEFALAHQRHIDLEESELLPMAQRLLADEDIARVRSEILGRRHALRGFASPC